MITESKVGSRIRTYREKLDMSVYDLATKSGIDEKLVNAIEKGEVLPALGVLTKLSRALHAVRVRGDAQTFTDGFHPLAAAAADRKSTRLNSSHSV